MRAHPRLLPRRTAATALVLLATAWGALMISAPPASATTYVGGDIASDTTWGIDDTVYVATKDVTVKATATLRIQPGVTVKFDPGVHLYVEGALIADGNRGLPIAFQPNDTGSPVAWGGVQFNASSVGSVSWSTFDRAERAVTAIGSSPSLRDNTVVRAGIGFALSGSASILRDNVIQRATMFGVYLNTSSVQAIGNSVNGTARAFQVEQPGTSVISGNTITNVSGAFPVAIAIALGATAEVTENAIVGIQGSRGADGIPADMNGRDGAVAIGIYVDDAPSAWITGNTIETVIGGRGGDGAPNFAGTGGRGGDGGAAGGIVVANTPTILVQGNTITGLTGGRGGTGGGGAGTANGGRGGDAGSAIGIELALAGAAGRGYLNTIRDVFGGVGGAGAAGIIIDGNGGVGGKAHGMFFISVADADATSNTLQDLRGGLGGNTSGNGAGTGTGAPGGSATGITLVSVVGTATIHSNTIEALTGGDGGLGVQGGAGGDATGVFPIGNNDGAFNETAVNSNGIRDIVGGGGGIGSSVGGDGGTAAGIGAVLVAPSLASNSIETLQGGRGGDATDGSDGGRGGDASGIAGGLVADGRSSGDSISGVTKGGVGAGPPAGASYANGYYFRGNASFTTRFIVENGTLASIGDYEFFADNYTGVISLNTTFTKHAVRAAGNLTVQNFLEVRAFWPNGVAPVAGARVRVEDNGFPVWDRPTSSGIQAWIRVTDRVYLNSNTATQNATTASVTYAPYAFPNNPRSVDMAASHAETFVMIDVDAPTSVATPLPTYRNAFNFPVGYSASDGNGTGVRSITLWYRTGGSGAWTAFATQAAAGLGQFSFTAASDGAYEFATTVDDLAGNAEAPASTNESWTIVDTVRPGSRVDALPQYEASLSFLVTWAPDPGVTDIVTYTIQYNAGASWTTWLVDTPATSGTFSAASEGPYAFRSIARDAAGNVEVAPAANDTSTIVDVTRPRVTSNAPVGANTNTTPVIVITFSEPMNRGSVEEAFRIVPAMDGEFAWSADSRTLTFTPARDLQVGTTYTVEVATAAVDVAGNGLLQNATFQFSTAPPPFTLSDYWWLFPILAALAGGAILLVMRRRTSSASKSPPAAAPLKGADSIIDDVFLLSHRDGLLIKHETRRLRPDVDSDILGGMLTAVQAFVKDALRGDDSAELSEMTVGQMHIVIGRGSWLVVAAKIEGDGSEAWTRQIDRCIKDMEDHHWDQLEDWDGDMGLARVLSPYVKKLIQGGYA